MPEVKTYTERQRHLEAAVIENLKSGDTWHEVNLRQSWSFGVDADTYPHLFEGQTVLLETVQMSLITGLATYDFETGEIAWLFRKTDQDLQREHEEMVKGFREKDAIRLEAMREEWTRREAALPEVLQRRLARFHVNGGREFELSGWGYELIVCELAAMYAKVEPDEEGKLNDSEEISEFARNEGTSGNQHDFAKALSRALISDDPEAEDAIANSVSALSPITGDSDYSKAGKGEI